MLLIMDNAPIDLSWLENLHAHCLVVFLPPRTTSLVQPLDQEIIATVKQFYRQQVYSYLWSSTETQVELAALEVVMRQRTTLMHHHLPLLTRTRTTVASPAEMSVMIFWCHFTVKNAVDYLLTAWDKVSEATVNHA
ncbi:hypothetical protein Pcinc_023599 [Petrolisthes cinctipes]|uniref:DDE-1 domain-containing protein n=1 Tax=Petrolisthes cinctipes TaxID=88211 RepID=A0AAE1KEY8_PETCI|nr:hypothetical protein Pcinc_023599 [Petrolisthes cinctipes]